MKFLIPAFCGFIAGGCFFGITSLHDANVKLEKAEAFHRMIYTNVAFIAFRYGKIECQMKDGNGEVLLNMALDQICK